MHSDEYMRGFADGVNATKRESLKEIEWLKQELSTKNAERKHFESSLLMHLESLRAMLKTTPTSAGGHFKNAPRRLEVHLPL